MKEAAAPQPQYGLVAPSAALGIKTDPLLQPSAPGFLAMALLPAPSASTTNHAQCMQNTWQVRAKQEASGMAVPAP